MRVRKKTEWEEDCNINKLISDTEFEYGLDQNKFLYIRKKNCIAWELFHPYRIKLETRRDTRNITELYSDKYCIKIGKSKGGKFYKRMKDGPWTEFTKEKDLPVFFCLGKIIATKANHYWVQCVEGTIVRETVIVNKNSEHEKHKEGYHSFVAANISKHNTLYQKLVFDNVSLDRAVEILMYKKNDSS